MTDPRFAPRSDEELRCLEFMKILLITDRAALFRILQVMKEEIFKEEARVEADEIIRRISR